MLDGLAGSARDEDPDLGRNRGRRGARHGGADHRGGPDRNPAKTADQPAAIAAFHSSPNPDVGADRSPYPTAAYWAPCGHDGKSVGATIPPTGYCQMSHQSADYAPRSRSVGSGAFLTGPAGTAISNAAAVPVIAE